MVELRRGLPPPPLRMQSLPLNEQGYPTPFFVSYVDGKPDFRLADPQKLRHCIKYKRCWLCGQPLGTKVAFVIGPMCLCNHLSSEPPSHDACARWALVACPFLTRPRAKRREANRPEDINKPGGFMFEGNPGVCVLYATKEWSIERDPKGKPLVLIGEPLAAPEWYTEGRPATYDEALDGFEHSIRNLREFSEKMDGTEEARVALEADIEQARRHLPARAAA